jgi:hypothetical protein
LAKRTTPESDSNLTVQLTLKGLGLELSTQGTLSELAKNLPALRKFLADAASEFPESSSYGQHESSAASVVVPSEAPAIKVTKGTTENIRLLFNTPWGKTPRSIGDVMDALQVNAVPDRAESVNVALTRQVKSGLLRRLKKDGNWVYYKVPET